MYRAWEDSLFRGIIPYSKYFPKSIPPTFWTWKPSKTVTLFGSYSSLLKAKKRTARGQNHWLFEQQITRYLKIKYLIVNTLNDFLVEYPRSKTQYFHPLTVVILGLDSPDFCIEIKSNFFFTRQSVPYLKNHTGTSVAKTHLHYDSNYYHTTNHPRKTYFRWTMGTIIKWTATNFRNRNRHDNAAKGRIKF